MAALNDNNYIYHAQNNDVFYCYDLTNRVMCMVAFSHTPKGFTFKSYTPLPDMVRVVKHKD